jgi:hypothetical protein
MNPWITWTVWNNIIAGGILHYLQGFSVQPVRTGVNASNIVV